MGAVGIEPTTARLSAVCSTTELRSLSVKFSRFLSLSQKLGGGEGEALSQPPFYHSVSAEQKQGRVTELSVRLTTLVLTLKFQPLGSLREQTWREAGFEPAISSL